VRLHQAPQFAEHTGNILRKLGADDDTLIALKVPVRAPDDDGT